MRASLVNTGVLEQFARRIDLDCPNCLCGAFISKLCFSGSRAIATALRRAHIHRRHRFSRTPEFARAIENSANWHVFPSFRLSIFTFGVALAETRRVVNCRSLDESFKK